MLHGGCSALAGPLVTTRTVAVIEAAEELAVHSTGRGARVWADTFALEQVAAALDNGEPEPVVQRVVARVVEHLTASAYERSSARLCAGTVAEVVSRLGEDAGVVLDIGTGTGTVAAAASSSGRKVSGMDMDQSMVAFAARRHPHVAFARAALPRLPCADEAFDAVTANFVLNHTPDPRADAEHLRRPLRRGGQLVATIWPSQTMLLNQMWNDVMRQASVSPPPAVRLSPELDFERTSDGFAALLADAGLAHVDCHEMRWSFEVEPDELWVAVEAGIAVVGQTYRSQTSSGPKRMRTAFEEVTGPLTTEGTWVLPSIALLACAWRSP